MTKLFVGGFPLDADEMQIAQLLGPYCDIQTIKIVRDRKTGKCKGYAFVEVAGEEQALAAKDALNGTEMRGRELQLNIVEEQQAPVRRPMQRRPTERPSFDPTRPKRPRRPLN
ncbi:RNA-binding protein [Mucilaginibacter sp. RS28]|uniref:RNA-binding protein n=1 Tax=Mucilaginibacter straminoryzae TaxID=2932774 RepID=A0A9X1X6K4_9SPHI|nr:RNA-binding protein [Mucilaginibacter straminoryzae]MCJ8209614.1 RNA-binding protein [Mucilaginibacter straminoryzae]